MRHFVVGSTIVLAFGAIVYLIMRLSIYILIAAPLAVWAPTVHAEPPTRLELFSRSAKPLVPPPPLDRLGLLTVILASIVPAEAALGPCYRNVSPWPELPAVFYKRACKRNWGPTPQNYNTPSAPVIRPQICSRIIDTCTT